MTGGQANQAGDNAGTTGDRSYPSVGGASNTASGIASTVPGGLQNTAAGGFSFAADRRAKANHLSSFVWADSRDFYFTSSAIDQFSARLTGGARFITGVDGSRISNAGVTLAAGSWSTLSDRNVKDGFAAVDARGVLELPVGTWSNRAQGPSVRHIGPSAQDFHATFGLGRTTSTSAA